MKSISIYIKYKKNVCNIYPYKYQTNHLHIIIGQVLHYFSGNSKGLAPLYFIGKFGVVMCKIGEKKKEKKFLNPG